MSDKNNPLYELQKVLISNLLTAIKDGSATAADKAVARALLRDNNIQALPEANPQMMELATKLPFEPEVAPS